MNGDSKEILQTILFYVKSVERNLRTNGESIKK